MALLDELWKCSAKVGQGFLWSSPELCDPWNQHSPHSACQLAVEVRFHSHDEEYGFGRHTGADGCKTSNMRMEGVSVCLCLEEEVKKRWHLIDLASARYHQIAPVSFDTNLLTLVCKNEREKVFETVNTKFQSNVSRSLFTVESSPCSLRPISQISRPSCETMVIRHRIQCLMLHHSITAASANDILLPP